MAKKDGNQRAQNEEVKNEKIMRGEIPFKYFNPYISKGKIPTA